MALVKDTTLAKKRFYRHSFELRVDGYGTVNFHTLLINPEDFSMDEPTRASVTQTLGGAFVTDFGQGLPSVVISGTTGYRKQTNAEGQTVDGFEEFMNFRQGVYRSFISASEDNEKMHLFWYNWEDEEFYEIQPMSFRLQRNKSEPLLYRYEFRFTCIRKIGDKKSQLDNEVRNPDTKEVHAFIATSTSSLSEFLKKAF
jgi:hypothetical protein